MDRGTVPEARDDAVESDEPWPVAAPTSAAGAGAPGGTRSAAARLVDSARAQTLLCMVVVLAAPWMFVVDHHTRTVAVTVFVNVTLALSFQLLFGMSRLISFGHAAMYALGAYLFGIGTARLDLPFILAVVLALLCIAGFSALMGWVVLRLELLFLAVATLAFGEGLVILLSQLKVVGGEEGMPIQGVRVGILDQAFVDYHLAGLLCLVALGLALHLRSSRFGRAMRAIGDDWVAAGSSGVPVVRTRVKVFVLSAVLAGCAGIVYALTSRFIAPQVFGLDTSILILVMVVVGGLKSPWGAVLGAVTLTLLPEVFAPLLEISTLIYGCLLLVVFRFLPGGFVQLFSGVAGTAASLVRRLRTRR